MTSICMLPSNCSVNFIDTGNYSNALTLRLQQYLATNHSNSCRIFVTVELLIELIANYLIIISLHKVTTPVVATF